MSSWAWANGYSTADEDVPNRGEEYLRPYFAGPAMLELEPTGEVYLRLTDVDRSVTERTPMIDDDLDTVAAFEPKRRERATRIAARVLPHLHTAGIHLVTDAGTPATEADLAATTSRLDGRLRVTEA